MNLRPFIPLVIALIVLLLAGGAYGAAYYFLTQEETKAAKLEADIATKTAQLDQATRARSTLSTLQADEATLNQYSIGKTEIVPFLEALQNGGKALGASVDVVSVSDKNDNGHARISLSLSIEGSFDAVMRTLGAIEFSPYDGVIDSVTLDTSSANQKTATWTAAVLYSVGVRVTSTPAKP